MANKNTLRIDKLYKKENPKGTQWQNAKSQNERLGRRAK